jgi:hypothetical protein
MGYQANVLRVMIASPGDVLEERKIVTEEIYRWNDAHGEARSIILQPVKWETHSTPRLGKDPQAELNEQITESADILIGIFGNRIGTPTERHVSGTVEEIKNHVGAGKTAKVYFSDAPVPPSTIDPDQYKALQAFKGECRHLGLYATYADIDSFRRDFKQHLDIELNAPRYQWLLVRSPVSGNQQTQISEDSMSLLTTAAQGSGLIFVQLGADGDRIIADNKTFTDRSTRSLARWREAVNQIVQFGYAEELQPGTGRFEVTHLGYRAADKAELAKPIHVSARTAGTPDQQQLKVVASKPIQLTRIDYLHSTEACITSQIVELVGEDLSIPFDYNKVVELSNSARPDKNNYDHSGPIKLRLMLTADGRQRQMILPAHLQPRIVTNKQWITVTGSAETDL